MLEAARNLEPRYTYCGWYQRLVIGKNKSLFRCFTSPKMPAGNSVAPNCAEPRKSSGSFSDFPQLLESFLVIITAVRLGPFLELLNSIGIAAQASPRKNISIRHQAGKDGFTGVPSGSHAARRSIHD